MCTHAHVRISIASRRSLTASKVSRKAKEERYVKSAAFMCLKDNSVPHANTANLFNIPDSQTWRLTF
jgi:hypothetical protein